MIRLNTEVTFAARGINDAYGFLVKNGFSTRMAHQILNKDGKVLKYAHLEKLCVALNCAPHDLLEYVPSQNQTLAPNHPLFTLQKDTEDAKHIGKALKNLPLDKLKEISAFISNIEKQQ